MYKPVVLQLPNLRNTLRSSLILAIAPLIAGINTAFAQQQNLPVCQPPNPGEYLLLIISPSTNSQKQLRRALPPELKTTTCRYLNDTVTRIGGFKKIDDANRWARYVNSIVGLSAIITTRPTAVASTPTANNQTPTANYKPQRLGSGFAVLVDYFNRPELANQVKQVVGGDVGFVAYGQRPYLLATYTTNQKDAYKILQKLSEKGFFAVIVDSSKVMLLRSVVNLPSN
ncbi:MAG: hypothetical protein HXY43_11550 [Fischerella sp.]|jgi:hypothetical protein|uniref:hypothetical protein n=1 Tax=Fischerella sp. TaxID=1191 RepID=UPI0017ED7539|nr:hypothetical protein [Fischerella sp.]NWF59892.1 hypothetical protein [Fischerella sp.]